MQQKRLILQHLGDILHLELCSPPANKTDRLFFEELSEISSRTSAGIRKPKALSSPAGAGIFRREQISKN